MLDNNVRNALTSGAIPSKKKPSKKDKKAKPMVLLGEGSYGVVPWCISTQVPSVDRLLAKDVNGKWGVPVGRSIFIHGKPSSGKSTLCLHLCAEAQKQDGLAIYIDCEHKLDRNYAQKLKVNVNDLITGYPLDLEEALEMVHERITLIDKLLKNKDYNKDLTGKPIIIIFDSTSIATRAEGTGGSSMGEHARSLSRFLRVAIPNLERLNIALVFICQIKSKLQIGPFARGPKETFLGEDAISFHSTIGIRMQRIKIIKIKDEKAGDTTLFRVTKNQVANPLQEAEANLYWGKGFNYHESLCDLLQSHYGAKKREGGNYELKSIDIKWRGKRGLLPLFKEDKKAKQRVMKLISEPTRIKI